MLGRRRTPGTAAQSRAGEPRRGASLEAGAPTSPINLSQRFIGNSVFCFFQVFGRFSAKLAPKTPLERRGSSCSAGCTKNQPRRPILRPFRGNSEFGKHPPQKSAKSQKLKFKFVLPILNEGKLRTLSNFVLFPPAPEGPAEGPDCHFPTAGGGSGPIPVRLRCGADLQRKFGKKHSHPKCSHVLGLVTSMAPNPVVFHGFVTSMAPNHMNSWGLVPSVAPSHAN